MKPEQRDQQNRLKMYLNAPAGTSPKVTKIREFWHDTVSHEGAILKRNNRFEYSDQVLSSKPKRNYHPQIFCSLELIRLMPQNAQASCNVAMVMIIIFSLCAGLWVICVLPINAVHVNPLLNEVRLCPDVPSAACKCSSWGGSYSRLGNAGLCNLYRPVKAVWTGCSLVGRVCLESWNSQWSHGFSKHLFVTKHHQW